MLGLVTAIHGEVWLRPVSALGYHKHLDRFPFPGVVQHGRAQAMKLDVWQIAENEFPAGGTGSDKLRFLLRYAILAPSSHNSQPWRFAVSEDRVDLRFDFGRWLRVADSDRRELHISLGCALENFLIAAEHFGFRHEVTYVPNPADPATAASVRLTPGGSRASYRPPILFDMIRVRHTSHHRHENRPIPPEQFESLQRCCVEPGIVLRLAVDRPTKRSFKDMVVRGDLVQFADPAFRQELARLIGLGAFGTPWITSKLLKLIVRFVNIGRSQAGRDAALVESSPAVAFLASREDNRTVQIQVGQVYERISLMAASFGLWTQPMSQLAEVPLLKEATARLISPPVLVPQLPFRLGYAPAGTHTPRWECEKVLEAQAEAPLLGDWV
jgi:hypothetical protein